jgi:hypothetical protein
MGAVGPRRIQLVALNPNAVYRVFSATETYALRLALPGWRTADDLRLAAAWQAALADEIDLVVPRPFVARSGAPLVTVSGGATEPDRRTRWSGIDPTASQWPCSTSSTTSVRPPNPDPQLDRPPPARPPRTSGPRFARAIETTLQHGRVTLAT